MRTTNLIQSYLTAHPVSQQYQSDKAVKEFDVKKELSNRTFIKPLPSNGKLVRYGILDYPSEFRKDMVYDFKALLHAIKGEANDHELGRLNDVGMRLGGFAIASYLLTRKPTPMNKVFEFVGLGTFFAAMNLWPKLFIQLPAKLIHGVNVRQEYEDSFGRKKMFYQDHQFIPWDLYSDDEINDIGDKLGVPRNIPNRRDFIQEKMRKIALQNNTLWMLTAGFATPLLSALMCNALEKPLSSYLDKQTTKQADNLLTNFSYEIGKFDYSKNVKQFEEIIANHKGKPVSQEFIDAIHLNLSEGLDSMLSQSLSQDLEVYLPTNGKFNFTESSIPNVQNKIKEIFAGANLGSEELEKLVPSSDKFVEKLTQKGLLGGNYADFSEHTKVVQDLLKETVGNFVAENPNSPANPKLKFLVKTLIHSTEQNHESPLSQVFKSVPATVINDDVVSTLTAISKEMNAFKAKTFVLDKYAYIKAAQAPETTLANGWNQVQSTLFKAMKFTEQEVAQARLDNDFASKILREKLETITSNKSVYSDFVAEIEQALTGLQSRVKNLDMSQDATTNLYKGHVEGAYSSAEKVLKGFGFKHTVDNLVGFDLDGATSSKKLALDFITDRISGVKSSFYRVLNLADMYYRIAHLDPNLLRTLHNYPREVKEEIVELAKISMLEGHNSDFAVKFWQKRNPSPDTKDITSIEVVNGKVINKYFGKHDATEVAELTNDRMFYKAVMRLMFDDAIHPDTLAKLGNEGLKTDFLNYRRNAFNVFGNDKYIFKPNHIVGDNAVRTPSWKKFLLMGSSPNDMFHKWANQTFNSGKWFNTFGKMGIGLVAVTILSQFFFGRMKKPQTTQEVKS